MLYSESILYMKFPILASFIILSLVLQRVIKKNSRKEQNTEKGFWTREIESNHIRKKSLDQLNYIVIPFESLPIDILSENEIVKDCIDTIKILAKQKVVNLTGISNTDLKLKYGTANITLLMEYDQNYTLLVCTLQKWATILYDAQYYDAVRVLLEFSISTKADVAKSYYLLAKIYHMDGKDAQIKNLINIANTLSSLSKNTIVQTLKESYPYND